jgi:kynurenine formamidase
MDNRPAGAGDNWREFLDSCSNTGRWGSDDQRGTLNLVIPQRVLEAVQTVQFGQLVSIGYDLPVGDSSEGASFATLTVMHQGGESRSATDVVTIAPHGFSITHLDAPCHVFSAGRAYNGRHAGDVLGEDRLLFGGITAMAGGIVTRGVLLDIAEARGVRTLLKGEGISCADLAAAEDLAETSVHEGDAIFVRSGIGQDKRWSSPVSSAGRPGVLPEVIPWLYKKGVAVYSGDCVERLSPAGDEGDMPLHEVGLSAMGLVILDNPNVEALRRACDKYQRREFLLFVAPLRIPGATGSAVNPIAVF